MKNTIVSLVLLLILNSCSVGISDKWVNLKDKNNDISISDSGVNVDIWWNKVDITDSWVNVDIWWNKVDIIDSWVKVNFAWNIVNISDLSDEEILQLEDSDYIQEQEFTTCEKNYSDLFKIYWKNYNDCYFEKPNVSSCEIDWVDKWQINLVIIMDLSWSMGAKIWNETMIDIAKEKLSDYISELESNTNLSFIIYWHKWDWTNTWKNISCNWVETIYNFSDNNLPVLVWKINNLSANWRTPISKSLGLANNLIKKQAKQNDKNIILLVSDWKETCWGDPVKEALEIIKTKNTYIDVIWFNVKWDSEKQLMDIAKNGNWNYYNVKSKLDFEDTFNKTKSFLDTMSCWASKAAIELNYWVEAINKYYTCMYNLKEEQIFMMADANDTCKDYFQDKLEKRYSQYEKKFSIIEDKADEILDNFSDLIKEVKDKFD